MKRAEIRIDQKFGDLLLEVVEDALYRVAISMEEFKGGPMTKDRKELTRRQERLDALQHEILMSLGPKGIK